MDLITTTPFGQRMISAAHLANQVATQQAADLEPINKWHVLDQLGTARRMLGVSDRDLAVLHSLISFYPGKHLDPDDSLVVFPSNKTLCDRTHGMAESTLRRHIAALVDAGLIQRHDSPNGKRFRRRGQGGQITRAFGFDLRPLVARAAEIEDIANKTKADIAALHALREDVMVMKRDAIKLMQHGRQEYIVADWDNIDTSISMFTKQLRRKLNIDDLTHLRDDLLALLKTIHTALETEILSRNDAQNERHLQNSNTDISKSKKPNQSMQIEPTQSTDSPERVPLSLVLKACPDIQPFAQHQLRAWDDLEQVAETVSPMMSVSTDTWENAKRNLGRSHAAATLAAMLQRIDQIKSPNAYLNALVAKATKGGFSPLPMITTLLSKQGLC